MKEPMVNHRSGSWALYFKRAFDLLLACILLLFLSPVFLVAFLLVRLKLGSPAIFKQCRPGFHENLFTVKKFRTMTDARDQGGHLLSDEQRLTSFGQFLRKTSLDELPQLWNVLVGEMSFVGPRPLLEEYLPLYNERQRERFNVRPGITGWAQVNGRNAISWPEKFELDAWYVEHQTFLLDMKILWMTFLKVIRQKDIQQDNHVTMEKFKGNDIESNK